MSGTPQECRPVKFTVTRYRSMFAWRSLNGLLCPSIVKLHVFDAGRKRAFRRCLSRWETWASAGSLGRDARWVDRRLAD
jgi:hypothetical protein